MTDIARQQELAVAHIVSLGGEALPDDCYSPELTAWSPVSGLMSRSQYLDKLPDVRSAFSEPLAMQIDRCTSEPGATAVQCRSSGVLRNGAHYSNDYHMLVEFDAEGRIRHVREYMDSQRAQEVLMPFLREWMARQAQERAQA